MTLGRNFDSYYDPPEETETPICEDCGQEKSPFYSLNWSRKSTRMEYTCKNDFCPSNFSGTEKEMAQALVDALDTVSRLEGRVKFLNARLQRVDPNWT